jgi:hypothetical protein
VTPDEHFVHLAEFIRGVELAGGTTPHVAMTVESMFRLDDPLEKLWFAGCYALTYNWPAAERLFLEWRPEDVNAIEMLPWLEEHWAGLPLRKERKAVFRKPFFAESAAAYATFAQRLLNDPNPWDTMDYTAAFTAFNAATRYMGRYIAIRWLEVMRRAFGTPWEMPSILSDGGEHSRKTLALIYPADAEMLLKGNTARHIAVSDAAANRLRADLGVEYGIETNFYELQSLLCEYKQSALGRKQYPGKSIDTEMDYFTRVYDHWGFDKQEESTFLDVRALCFPEWSLGEAHERWWGVRPELGAVLADFGYTWSDAVYDYPHTTDFSDPFRWVYGGRESLL